MLLVPTNIGWALNQIVELTERTRKAQISFIFILLNNLIYFDE